MKFAPGLNEALAKVDRMNLLVIYIPRNLEAKALGIKMGTLIYKLSNVCQKTVDNETSPIIRPARTGCNTCTGKFSH